jgi:hypothetical protein
MLQETLVGQKYYQEQTKHPDLLIIEDKGSGISLRQVLSQHGIDSFPYNPGRADKLSRLHAVSHIARHGRIWLPESDKRPGKPKDWVEPVLKQLCVYSGPGTTPHDDWVDSCCTSSANILMGDGSQCPIGDIQAGNMVATPLGPRRVLQAGATGIKPIWRLEWNGGFLEGTGNHPVWADGRWRRLDSLNEQSTLTSWHGKPNPASLSSPSILADSSITDTLNQRRQRTENTFRGRGVRHCIVRYGSIIADQFQQGTRFITKMMTSTTMIFPIWNVSLASSMTTFTGNETSIREKRLSIWRTLTGFGKKLRSGIQPVKGWNGTPSTLTRASLDRMFLNGVAYTSPTVKSVFPLNRSEVVYNLRVEEAECYYANGILVHNCSQAWRVFSDRFVADGVFHKLGKANDDGTIIPSPVPMSSPEFEYQYDIESGREQPKVVRAPYD